MLTDTTARASPTVRQLPPEEWERLRDFPLAERYGIPDPRGAAILVAETPAGEIVGVWAALTTVHLDGLWIAPEYRRTSLVAAKLLRGMKAMLTQLGIVHSFTLVESPEVLVLALKAGFQKLPYDLCFLDLTSQAPDSPTDPPPQSQGDPPCQP
jgi:hypothetical protein